MVRWRVWEEQSWWQCSSFTIGTKIRSLSSNVTSIFNDFPYSFCFNGFFFPRYPVFFPSEKPSLQIPNRPIISGRRPTLFSLFFYSRGYKKAMTCPVREECGTSSENRFLNVLGRDVVTYWMACTQGLVVGFKVCANPGLKLEQSSDLSSLTEYVRLK